MPLTPARSARLRCERLELRDTPAVIAGFTETVFASGLTQPTAMAVAPDGRIFVAEKAGTLRVVQNGAVLPTPFLTVGVDTFSERGLIGVALDPNFAANNFVYVYYTTNAATPVNRVSRFTASGNVGTNEVVLLDNIPSTNGNHNGGALVFRPDGKLYVAVGDAGPPNNSQTLANLNGKVLRLNPDGSIPADNPFFATATGDNRAIYALGLRNPFTMAVQPGTGRLFINDVGGASFEEVNEGIPGANYGWPATEGDFSPASFPNFTRPVYAYAHGTGPLQGNSIAGGAFYNPATASFPAEYVGDYFFADFIRNRIFVRDNSTGAVTTFADRTAGTGVVDLDVLPDGRLLYLSLVSGTITQIAATGAPVPAEVVAVGAGPGGGQVAALSADGSTRFTVPAYDGYAGGVRVGSGDVTGDGVEDVVTGTSAGAPPHVKVFDGATGGLVRSFFAFDQGFLGGLSVAAADVTGDGIADLIVGTASGASHVKVFDGATGAEVRSFFAFDGFAGGVTVAAGDVTGDGRADLIVGTASGSSHVKVFDGQTGELRNSFFAFAPGFAGGVSVGFASGEVAVGAAVGSSHVKTFANGVERQSFFAFDPGFPGGVRVAGNANLLLVGAGTGAGSHLKGFAAGSEVLSRFVFDPAGAGGIFVG